MDRLRPDVQPGANVASQVPRVVQAIRAIAAVGCGDIVLHGTVRYSRMRRPAQGDERGAKILMTDQRPVIGRSTTWTRFERWMN